MMHAPLRKTSAASTRSARRRFQGIWILATFSVIALVAGCSPADDALATTNGLQVLGLYEFTFENVGTDAMTASVARVDDGVGSLALGTDPVTELSLALVDDSKGAVTAPGGTGPTRVEPGGGRNYIWAEYEVTNTNATVDLTGITFLGYSSVGNSVDGSAFASANAAVSAADIRPSGEVRLHGTNPQRIRLDLLDGSYGMSVVAYDEANDAAFQAMNAALSGRSFVNTVFPYGFAATATAGDSRTSRTIAGGQTGSLIVGFNAPDLNTVRWRAVAVLDDRVRIASPTEYNYRGNQLARDGFEQFLELATAIETNNGGAQAEVVVLGAMFDGDRTLPAETTCATFDFVEIADVRVAGGFGDVLAQYLIGGIAPSDVMTKVTKDGENCVP